MIAFNFEKKIESLIVEKPNEVIAQVTAKIVDVFQFDIFKRQYIEKLWHGKGDIDQSYIICINELDIENIDFSKAVNSKLFVDNILNLLNDNNIIWLNNNLEVTATEYISNGLSNYCDDLSKKNVCVFLLSRYGVKVIVDGDIIQNSLFIGEKDFIEYSKKKDISQIEEIFEQYQSEISAQLLDISNFFEDKSISDRLGNQFLDKNILIHQPEKFMKEHLRDFLNKNVRRTFNMNYILSQSKREIDIYTEDNDFYFFTIKWLGISINNSGTSLESLDYTARCGVTQTLEYIRELIELEGFSNKTLKKGCLVVFDARDNKEPIKYNNFSFIDVELNKCFI